MQSNKFVNIRSGIRLLCLLVLLIILNQSVVEGQSILPYEISAGIISYDEGEFYRAIQQLESAVSKYPMRIESHVYLASAYLATEDYTATIKSANKGLEIFPENLRLRLVLSEALYRSGDDKAISEYLEILDLLEKNQDLESTSGISYNQVKTAIGNAYQGMANEAYQDGRSEEAISLYFKAREYNPGNITIHNNLAFILFENERFDESLDVLVQANEMFPGAEQINVLRGQIYNEKNDTEKLLEVYSELHSDYPENLDYAIIYGQLLMSNNQAQKANLLFETLIAENPTETKLYDLLIRMNEQRYDYGGKRNVLKMQRNAFPDDRGVAEALAQTHVLIEEFEEARSIYDSLAVYDESEKYEVLSARTWVFEESYDIAIQKYEAILINFDENTDLLSEVALLYREINKPKQAIELLVKADSLESSDRVKVQIAHLLTDLELHQEANHYLNDLAQSRFDSFSKYYITKYSEQDLTDKELINIYMYVITDMISLFQNLYEKYTAEVSETANSMNSNKPKLYQKDPVLSIIEETIDDFFTHISKRFAYNETMEIIEHALSIYPESAKVLYYKGQLAYDNQYPSVALNSFRKAVEHGATDHSLFFQIGDIYTQQGETNKAILSYEQALTLNPEYGKAYSQLIAVSQEARQLDQLCNRWLMKYKTNKQNLVLKEYLIEALHKADRFEEANQILRGDDSR